MSRSILPETYQEQEQYLLDLCKGKRVREIAQERQVPLGTVVRELQRLRKSLGVKNNIQAAARVVFGL